MKCRHSARLGMGRTRGKEEFAYLISAELAPQGDLPGAHIWYEQAGPPPVGVPMVQDLAKQISLATAEGRAASTAATVGSNSCIVALGIAWTRN